MQTYYKATVSVSIHATLAGGDDETADRWLICKQFLSTPPSRVATLRGHTAGKRQAGFYPRHPRGWRPGVAGKLAYAITVSIHATLAGGDRAVSPFSYRSLRFLSTPPSRVATTAWSWTATSTRCFYPRHPRGWRPENNSQKATLELEFLSTPPSRVATLKYHHS